MSKHKGPVDPESLPYRPCVGLMVLNKAGLVWAGRRIVIPGDEMDGATQLWQMPQGGIDKGETPRQAALRELVEETGVTPELVDVVGETADWVTYDLPPELLGKVWKGKYGGQKQKWFAMRFLGPDDAVRIATEHPEFERWQWMRAADVLESIVPFKRAVYAQVLGEFRDILA